MNIELKNIKINNAFSDETVCFKADLYVDNIKVAICVNAGCGGNTNISSYPGKEQLLNTVEVYAKSLPQIDCVSFKLDSDLEIIVDSLIDDEFNKKEKEKDAKKIQKLCLTNIVFGVPNSHFSSLGYKMPISEVLKRPDGKELIEKLIVAVKSRMKSDDIILNTNLKEFGI
jgi:hypothetical protein